MKNTKKKNKRVNAPVASFFPAAVLGILFNAEFAPGPAFWRVLFLFSISSLLFLIFASFLWKRRARSRLNDVGQVERNADADDSRDVETPERVDPSALRDVYESEYWKNWLEKETARRKRASEPLPDARLEKGGTWNDALALFLKERREGRDGKANVDDFDEEELRAFFLDGELSAPETPETPDENADGSGDEKLRSESSIIEGAKSFFRRTKAALQSFLFYVDLCAWLAFFALCGWRHEIYYNYFPQNEVGLLATENALGTTLELRVGKTPVLYKIDDVERSARGDDEVTTFTATALRIKNGGKWQEVSGRVDVSVSGDATRLRIGDKIVVSGKLSRPKKQGNPGERDRVFYYRAQRILATLSVNNPENVEVESEERFSFFIRVARALERTRLRAAQVLRENLSPENAAVACGMTFGFRNEVDDEINDAFRRTGVVHLLAISGLHVVLVVGLFVSILRRFNCPEQFVSVATLFLVFFYLGLTDMRAPVIRATILIVVASVGSLIGRRGVSLNTLAFAAVALLLLNPCELFQVGAQLSFLATGVFLWSGRATVGERAETSSSRYAAIRERRRIMARKEDKEERTDETQSVASRLFGFVKFAGKRRVDDSDASGATSRENDRIDEQKSGVWSRVRYRLFSLGRRIGDSLWGKVRAATTAGCVVWATTAPLLLRTTNLATPIAVVANPLVWLPATLALTLAFLLAFSGLCVAVAPAFFGAVVSLLGPLTELVFSFFLGAIKLLARPDYGSFHTPSPPVWTLFLFYAPLAFWTLFPHLRPGRRVFLPLLALWICSFVGANYYERAAVVRSGTLRVEVLSIGHGVAVLGFMPDGRAFLCDCGSTVAPRRVARTVSKILWDSGRSSIDLAIVSHADYDHYSGLTPLLELVSVKRVCFSPYSIAKNSGKLTELLDATRRAKTPTEIISGGETLARLGFPELSVLHPVDDSLDDAEDGTNANSLVISLSCLGRNFLFPGDLDAADAPFLRTAPTKYDLILAPHHGGKSDSSREVLDWSDPTWVVVSGGTFVRNRAAEEELRAEGRFVAHTMDDGCVRIEVQRSPVYPNGRGRTRIKTFRSGRVYESDDL